METIKSLKGVDFESIFSSFSEAFSEYEVQVNKQEFRDMLERKGYESELSFAAFHNNKIIAFSLSGVGIFNGKKSAYDICSGTLKEYRGQGNSTKIFNYSIPFLKEAGVEQYVLEVLQHNTKAVSVYKNVGFEVSREFNYFVKDTKDVKLRAKNIDNEYTIKLADLSRVEEMSTFCDFNPSWQNNFDSVARKLDNFKIFGAYNQQSLIGYCVLEDKTGDITQIAVDEKHRRKGVATNLLQEAMNHNNYNSIKFINVEPDCVSLNGFLKYNSIEPLGKQYEMIREL